MDCCCCWEWNGRPPAKLWRRSGSSSELSGTRWQGRGRRRAATRQLVSRVFSLVPERFGTEHSVESRDAKAQSSVAGLCRRGFQQDNAFSGIWISHVLLELMHITGIVAAGKENLFTLDVVEKVVEHL